MRRRRREMGISQVELASRSGVSLGSIRRFERLHEISLSSLVRISIVLRCDGDFEALFARKGYQDIEEAIRDVRSGARKA